MEIYEYLKEGFVVGYVVSVAFYTAALMSYYFYTWLHFRTTNKPVFVSPLLICNIHFPQISELERWIARMSFDEINKATDNFSEGNLIGIGKIGTMYKAILPNGVLLAVKRLNKVQSENHLISELNSVSRLRHVNLVPLLGFCIDAKENVLVYKYMPNGNLHNWLYQTKEGTTSNEKKPMEWSLRLKIGVGVARALAWLHHGSSVRLAHLNITSKCVLLDHSFEPKISNFSGAIFKNNSKSWEKDYAKRDVYSFGIVLLELITLKERAQMTSSFSASRAEQLIECAAQLTSSIFQRGHSNQGHDHEILMALRIALRCVQVVADQRPSMVQVYKSLKDVGRETYDSKMLKLVAEEV